MHSASSTFAPLLLLSKGSLGDTMLSTVVGTLAYYLSLLGCLSKPRAEPWRRWMKSLMGLSTRTMSSLMARILRVIWGRTSVIVAVWPRGSLARSAPGSKADKLP
ncbi:hypothetical protein CCUS01_15084 [Colletotrichum cuscutae]|uniref:Uncharacterized protein n=1 Tax=Colletotrichum cuscutae TaxID=1209917 RepID=A0AAI9VEW4_9PEZI|nr:hypothetical protein CCUS01_15084 [Colletotrichum cuscutae]